MARPALALLLALLALLVLRPGPAAAVSVWNTATIDSTGSVGLYTSPALDAAGRFSGPFFSAPAQGLNRAVDGLQVDGTLP